MSYTVGRKLGEGSFAKVFLLQNTAVENSEYALKVIDKDRFSYDERDKCIQEAKLTRKLRHQNIVACFDAFEFESHILLVTEFCTLGDMYCYLGNCRDADPQQPVSQDRIITWMFQIARALQYLHARKILHRDLKTRNIFLTEDLIVKIGDLGIAKQLDFTLAEADTFLGTPMYMCPEIFQFQPYSYKADIWGFGCCVYEMMTLRFAFESPSQKEMVQRILKGKPPAAPSSYHKHLGDIASQMLKKEPKLRPTASEVIEQLQAFQETFDNGDNKASARSRRRSAVSREDSRIDLPDLSSSLRSDRHAVVDSLMEFFNKNTASGIGNGFDVNVLSSTKSGLSRTVNSIWTRCPSQEETTLFTRQFGTNVQDSSDEIDSVDYEPELSEFDTVKKSPRKMNRMRPVKSTSTTEQAQDVFEDVHQDDFVEPQQLIQWAKENLVSCQTPVDNISNVKEEKGTPVSSDKTTKPKKKKRNVLKVIAEKRKQSLSTEQSEESHSEVEQSTGNNMQLGGSLTQDNSKVTLFTRSQKVVFKNTEFLAGDTISESVLQSTSTEDTSQDKDIKRLCEAELGSSTLERVKQLVDLIKDKHLLEAQLQDLIGWRSYRKYGAYLMSLSRKSS